MFLLDPATTERYLRDRGELDAHETVRVSELSGGVSNQVLLVERSRGDRFVLKQAREQLRVEQEWKCDVRRIWQEVDALKICREIIDSHCLSKASAEYRYDVPHVLFSDSPNYCYAMNAAPAVQQTWKQLLLNGEASVSIARSAGMLLGDLHGASLYAGAVAQEVYDPEYFVALRIDPYYRRIAAVHPRLAEPIEHLIERTLNRRRAFVHGDFSPKNLLVFGQSILLIDFEVGHWGDPAFDNGFFLSHLILKTLWSRARWKPYLRLSMVAWESYRGAFLEHHREGYYGPELEWHQAERYWTEIEEQSTQHLAACLLARVDGKSPVDYLSADLQLVTRTLASDLLMQPPAKMDAVFDAVKGRCESGS